MSVLVNAKSNSHRKTRHVESGGTGQLSSCTLPGEVSIVRATEKSAEAIVAMMPLKGGGAKGQRTGNATMDKLVKEAHWDGAIAETTGEGNSLREPASRWCQNGGSVATKLVPTVVSETEDEHVRRA